MAFSANNPTASGMVLTFDDEFSTPSISADGAANGTTWTNHLWYMPASPTSFSVSNGVLNVGASGAAASTVDSAGKGWQQKFGYFEASIELPSGSGTWPSFWLVSNDRLTKSPTLPGTEIDIREGQTAHQDGYLATNHRDSAHAGQDIQNTDTWVQTGGYISQAYHRFGMLWDPNSSTIDFYFDGTLVKSTPKYDTTDSAPMQMILGNGIGDVIGSNPTNANTWANSTMKVDWVHVYQFANQNPTPTPTPAPTPTPSPAPTPTPVPTSGADTLLLHVAADRYQGGAQFTVLVDGKQVGGVQTADANHSAGQWQDITLKGGFGTGAHKVDVNFINNAGDGQSGDGHDRNLYVGYIALDGHRYQGNAAIDTASLGYTSMDPNAAVMVVNGTASFATTIATPTPTPTPTPVPTPTPTPVPASGSDTVLLHVSADRYLGDPQFTIMIDGKQVGGVLSTHASHSAGTWQNFTVHGDFGTGAHVVDVNFINDANDGQGGDGHDRNLYVGYVDVDGHRYQGNAASDPASLGYTNMDPNAAVMVVNGTASFHTNIASPAPISGPVTSTGNDIFVFSKLTTQGNEIGNFTPGHDLLDLRGLMQAIHYNGTDPLHDNILHLVQSGANTAVVIDPHANNDAAAHTVVTLDHLTPSSLKLGSDILWH